MNTLNKYEMKAILGYLADVERHAEKMVGLEYQEARVVWMGAIRDDLRCARERLFDASLTDIQVEPPAPAIVRKIVPGECESHKVDVL